MSIDENSDCLSRGESLRNTDLTFLKPREGLKGADASVYCVPAKQNSGMPIGEVMKYGEQPCRVDLMVRDDP
jgi:hypothetical protein